MRTKSPCLSDCSDSSLNANSTASKSCTWDGSNTTPSTSSPHLSPSFLAFKKLSMINEGALQVVAPWAQLIDLAFECDSPDVAVDVLSQCANLTSASMNVEWSLLPDVRPDIPIQFIHLRSLHLRLEVESASFFDYLSTPALQELELWLYGEDPIEPHFTAFQLQAPNITSLQFIIDPFCLTSENLVAAIRHASSLTHLTLCGCEESFTDDFIRALHNDGVTPLAPCLHNLVVNNRALNLTEDLLASMIASRWWSDPELAACAVPPAAARWTYVELQFGLGDEWHHFGPGFTDIVKDVPSHVLVHANYSEYFF
ncbi:hypothetical protein MSAN_01342400 [Mycena sanguinolenta]|uniref:Uncharacterized protein n=1 Tax=Mycena sanguinolenta TaxID=230812 RepID=A0A8H7D3K0_9AGAR|nr:hypothetical protein MSAN_01342400 [Mycena sanguinolenta]